jgi:hypothetical protein
LTVKTYVDERSQVGNNDGMAKRKDKAEFDADDTKSGRQGVPLNIFIPTALAQRLEHAIESRRLRPTKTSIVVAALEDFLSKMEAEQPPTTRRKTPAPKEP